MSDITIIHNPRCSKSRQTLALLEEKGATPSVVEYLKTPLNVEELESIFKKLNVGSIHYLIQSIEHVRK